MFEPAVHIALRLCFGIRLHHPFPDDEGIHDGGNGHGFHGSEKVFTGKIVHGMGMAAQEREGEIRERTHREGGRQAEKEDEQCRKTNGNLSGKGEIVPVLIKLLLPGRMLFDKDRHKELGHIAQCQAAGNHKDDFHGFGDWSKRGTLGHIFQDALVQQGFRHKTAPERNAGNAESGHQEADL